ncbi:PrpF protein [Talaromyces proteolyticus]|uniref:PrpF protein n=1 Tax=Talaromyces proteolyticus TaxID=1131652 RepID=A0AAD4KUV8_9EURO|nr:PrpF protein [Talaromyces proteolyticus]KAH8698859.1 PrpF protein [Talaromyces proteolyticus]
MAQKDQIRIPAVYMRGGSSKAVFLRADNIPPPGPIRDSVLKRVMGTPDPIQVDGMGGAKAVTSKIAIISPSTRDNVDIDYTFAQVGVRDDTIDYKLNCGNISAAVGPYAIDEGLIPLFRPGRMLGDANIKTQEVRIYNTGTEKLLIAHVPVDDDRRSITQGTCGIAGVPGTAAPILLDYRETTGAGLNRGILPTGNSIDFVDIGQKKISFTICDVANVYIFASASDFNVSGHESTAALTANTRLLGEVNELRGKAAQMVGMCKDWEKLHHRHHRLSLQKAMSLAASFSITCVTKVWPELGLWHSAHAVE